MGLGLVTCGGPPPLGTGGLPMTLTFSDGLASLGRAAESSTESIMRFNAQ